MKIKYLYNSGFVIEKDDLAIVIDAYIPKEKDFLWNELESSILNKEKIYFLVSHGHHDHYEEDIFKYKKENVKYILEKNVTNEKKEDVKYLKKGDIFDDGTLKIKAYGSTDEGISFYIEVEGIKIFHSGDLNWWHWTGETKAEREFAERFFMEEINAIEEKSFDYGFFPIDPRQGEAYYYGAKYFLEKFKVKNYIPMHFREDFALQIEFKDLMEREDINFLKVEEEGKYIEI